MKCKLCGNEKKKLAKSHIIPKWCYSHILKDNSRIIMKQGGIPYPKRIPTGIYDKKILCADCEKKFDYIDSTACNLFCHTPPSTVSSEYLEFSGRHKKTVLLFIQSLLLRATLASSSFFRGVNAHEYIEGFHHAILTQTPFPTARCAIIKSELPDALLVQSFGTDGEYVVNFYGYTCTICFKQTTELLNSPADFINNSWFRIYITHKLFTHEHEALVNSNSATRAQRSMTE